MDFSVIFQLRTKKFWWMDVIFYFVMSLLVATILCYLIFLVKNSFQRSDIEKEAASLQTVGTMQQKQHEQDVINYQKKIKDFSDLFKNHGFASQVFSFMQQETRPNVWFATFGLHEKEATVDLSGESDDNEAFSRQVAVFEKNEYVKSINVLNSSLDKSSKLKFNLSLSLDPKIFNYDTDLQPVQSLPSITETVSSSDQSAVQTENQGAPVSDKLIIIFKFTQPAEVNGVVDLKNNSVELDVPFGTDVTKLTPSIAISPKSTISPQSGAQQDFTNPVVYSVTAEDGSTQNYNVSVKVLPKVVEKSSKSLTGIILAVILSILVVAAVIVGAFFVYKKRINNKAQVQ